MEGNTKISVIIPIYKAEKFLDKCIGSVVGQTYENLEIILVDDGSPDNCPAICDSWAEKDRRIKVVHKENGGLSSARNAGLDVVTGEYFGFIDSDDWIEKDFFEFLITNALKENADISRCGLYLDYEDDDSCHDQEVQYETPVVVDNKGYICFTRIAIYFDILEKTLKKIDFDKMINVAVESFYNLVGV